MRGKRAARKLGSIRTSMILAFMLLIFVIVACISLMSYQYTINDFESLSISYTTQLLGEINASIDAYIDNMKNMATVVVENRDVKYMMSYFNRYHNTELTDLQQAEQQALIERAAGHMKTVANTRGDITNIAAVSKYRDVVLSDQNKEVNLYSGYNIMDWFLRPLSYKDQIFVSPSHVQSIIKGEYKWVISISKAVLDPETDDVTGTMVIDLNYRAIESICENVNLEQAGYIYLIDSKKNIIYHPQQQLLYSGVKSEDFERVLAMDRNTPYAVSDNGEKIYIRSTSSTTGWIAVGVINANRLIRNRAGILRFYTAVAYIAIVLAAIVAFVISTRITRPIRRLESTMHRVEQGDLSVQADLGPKNEIGHLSKTFNAMIAEIRRLMENAVANEQEKRKSEIKALQAQINPHFLYNTLDTIIWMSARGKNDEVVEVTSALAHLFRTSISRGESLVELRVEMQNIESYLTIQKMRYKDKLSYRIEAPPETLSLMVPKLILQPVVENAVYHGIKPSENGGAVTIAAAMKEDALLVTIEDSGVGMTAEQLSQVFAPRQEDSGGVGVLNVHNRIQLLYGEEFGLRFESRSGGGTKVTMRLPAKEKGES